MTESVNPPFRHVKAETLTLSRVKSLDAAKAHLALPESPTEREYDPKRAGRIVEAIKARTVISFNWAVAAYAGAKHRMNGKHSSTALLDAADILPERLFFHMDYFEVDSPPELGTLFRQFDARWSARTKDDVAGAYQGLAPELASVSRQKAKLSIEGIAWYERSIEALPVPSGDDLYAQLLMPKYHGFVRWIDRILSIKTPELKKAPIVAAMYGTFLCSESGSQDFWPHVAKNDLTDDRDPRSVLSTGLVDLKESRDAKAPAPAELYAMCVKAWNAFRNGTAISSLNVNTKKGMPSIAA